MKNILIVLFCFAIQIPVIAQEELIGIWQGELLVDSDPAVVVQIIIEADQDGSLSAYLHAPAQRALQNIPATLSVSADSSISVEVAQIGGRFEGKVTSGILAGIWHQEDGSFPLELSQFEQKSLTDEEMNLILGSWVGTVKPNPDLELEFTVVFRFEKDSQGNFEAFMDIPDQAASGLVVAPVTFSDNELLLEIDRVFGKYSGFLSQDGQHIEGVWSQADMSRSLDLTKREFTVSKIELSVDQVELIEGKWVGSVSDTDLEFNFVYDEQLGLQATVDIPSLFVTGLPVGSFQIDDETVSFEVKAIGAEYSGNLLTNSTTGLWNRDGNENLLELIRVQE